MGFLRSLMLPWWGLASRPNTRSHEHRLIPIGRCGESEEGGTRIHPQSSPARPASTRSRISVVSFCDRVDLHHGIRTVSGQLGLRVAIRPSRPRASGPGRECWWARTAAARRARAVRLCLRPARSDCESHKNAEGGGPGRCGRGPRRCACVCGEARRSADVIPDPRLAPLP